MTEPLIYLAIAPVALILWYVYKKDVHNEPKGQLVKSFVFGVLITVPICIVEAILMNTFSTDVAYVHSYITLFINTFISIGLIEEFFKWLVVKLANYNNKHFDETYDAIVYSVFVSLGFAAFENIMYSISQLLTGGALASFITLFMRFLTAVPGHAFFGVYMGYYLSKAKIAQTCYDIKAQRKYLALALFVPALLHTLYDFFVFTQNELFILCWFVFVILLYVFGIKMVKNASTNNRHYNVFDLIDNNKNDNV